MPSRSAPSSAESVTSTARSAPIASALRSASIARSGPIETTTTSPSPAASLSFSASSTAIRVEVGDRELDPSGRAASSPGRCRRPAAASGTALTQTAIFMRARLYPAAAWHRRTCRYRADAALVPTSSRPRLRAARARAAASAAALPRRRRRRPTTTTSATRARRAPHQGNDLLGDKRAPAVAVEAGTVKYWTTSASAGCMLYLYGASGTMYEYIHLNNDLTRAQRQQGQVRAGRLLRRSPTARTSRRAARSATSATPATRTASIRTCTSRCTRTAARRSTRSRS